MIKRLIFDIDGTLICGVNFTNAVTNTLQKFNLYSEENVSSVIKAMHSYEDIYNSYTKKNYLKHISDYLRINLDYIFLDIYFDELKSVVNPKDKEKLKNKLNELSQKYELVLLSNYFEESQRNRLKTLDINDYFKEYYGEQITKPNIEAFLSAKGNNMVEECLMVGDSLQNDIYPAISINMPVLQIGNHIKDVSQINDEIIKKSLIINKLKR